MKLKHGWITRAALAVLFFSLLSFSRAQFSLVNPPTFPNTNTLRLTLTGGMTNTAYNILYSPTLDGAFFFTPYFTGALGQSVFDLNMPTGAAGVWASRLFAKNCWRS